MSDLPQPEPGTEFPHEGKLSVSWRNDPVILARLNAVAAMMLRGSKQYEISKAMECSIATTRRDITRVRTLWREELKGQIDEKREQSIAHYKLVQSSAWDAYNKTESHNFLRIILDAQAKIDDIEGNQAPIAIAAVNIDKVRAKRWQQIAGSIADILTEDEPDGAEADQGE